jgi:membrane protease YdiL (CAAX protease family)
VRVGLTAQGRVSRGSAGRYEFFSEIRRSRLLAIYLAAGPLGALYLAAIGYGTRFLVASLANLILLALYAAVTGTLTGQVKPRSLPVHWPRWEVLFLALYLAFLLARSFATLPELDLGVASQWLRRADAGVSSAIAWATAYLPLAGDEAASLQTALGQCFWLLLLPSLPLLVVGYRPATLGFRLDLWWLGLALVALGAWPSLAAFASGGAVAWPTVSVVSVLASLLAGVSVEFFFRALLLTRLQSSGLHWAAALVIVAIACCLSQAPGQIARQGYDLVLAAAGLVAASGAPASLAWGYLFLRTKSLAPGVLWHASPWGVFPF